MMRELPGYPAPTSVLALATWTRDLLYHDGPWIAEFRSPKGDPIIFAWRDEDHTATRWIACRVGERNLIRYTTRRCDLRSLMETPEDGFVYIVDIDETFKHRACSIVAPEDLPEEYKLPTGGILPPFDAERSGAP